MRKGISSLCGLVHDRMKSEVKNGDVFIFIGSSRKLMKLLHAEDGGMVMYVKRLEAGRIATRPLLQFYYVMDDDKTSTLDRVLIYAAIIYTISPVSILPSAVYKFLGVLDEGAAMLFVYKKIKDKITPEIDARVEETLNEWFGVECEVAE